MSTAAIPLWSVLALLVKSAYSRERDMWGFVDQIYVITGDWATHRIPELKKQLKSVGIKENNVMYWYGERDTINGHHGAWNAHAGVARHAIQHNHEIILVFEDDVGFSGEFDIAGFNSIISLLESFTKADTFVHPISSRPLWEFVHLVYNAFSVQQLDTSMHQQKMHESKRMQNSPGNHRIIRVHAWGMVAYFSSKRGMKKIAESVYPDSYGHTIDGVSFVSKHAYGIFPMVAIHRPGPSFTINKTRDLSLQRTWEHRVTALYKKSVSQGCCSVSLVPGYTEQCAAYWSQKFGISGHASCGLQLYLSEEKNVLNEFHIVTIASMIMMIMIFGSNKR